MRISDWSSDVCSSDLIARVDVPNSSQAGGRFQGNVSIPANCPVQILALVARSSHEIGGVSGQIDRILIHPARSEEHTSELQSLMRISYAVFCLKKNTKMKDIQTYYINYFLHSSHIQYKN